LQALPEQVQAQARRAYDLWRQNPDHPGVAFKELKPRGVFSARIGLNYRAVCAEVEPGVFIWDWIGSHSDYDKLVDSL
jgi:hypothetical protein